MGVSWLNQSTLRVHRHRWLVAQALMAGGCAWPVGSGGCQRSRKMKWLGSPMTRHLGMIDVWRKIRMRCGLHTPEPKLTMENQTFLKMYVLYISY